jgi:hypothetical protein
VDEGNMMASAGTGERMTRLTVSPPASGAASSMATLRTVSTNGRCVITRIRVREAAERKRVHKRKRQENAKKAREAKKRKFNDAGKGAT